MFPIPDWALGVGFIILVGYLGRALIGRGTGGQLLRGRLSRRDIGPALEDTQQRLAALEEGQRRLGEGEDVQTRLNEVEERLDFVERMLAKQRDAERVVPPKG